MFPPPLDAAPGTLLPPRVEVAPYRESVILAVARVDDCLPLRQEPGRSASVSECLPPGALIIVEDPAGAPVGQMTGGGGKSALAVPEGGDAPDQVWVHVRSVSGTPGWVQIQHLDWA